VDTSVHFSQNAPFAFQTLVTPFRGYEQNSIYGSQYGLLNVDLYFPIFKTLIPLQTGFTSLTNLQIGLFTDIAKTAGAKGLPLRSDQLSSFGYSLRTMLAGYPIRFDMAWPGILIKLRFGIYR
jgi:hemolysin activation/secretion protein